MVRATVVVCELCGLDVRSPVEGEEGRFFCCSACQEVDRLLRTQPIVASEDDVPIENTTTVGLELSGMWCASCSWAIEETLLRTPGVQSADVSFVSGEARVDFDDRVTSPARLKRRVRRLGYRASLPEDKSRDEENSVYYRLLIGAVFTMNVMMISLSLYAARWLNWWAASGREHIQGFLEIILLVGSIPVLVILGIPILKAGMVSLARGRPNIHTLIAIGSLSAFGLSVRNLIVGSDRLYFDTATVLLLLVTFGHWLELRARKKGTEAVDKLWRQIPEQATLVTRDGLVEVAVEDVSPGDRVLVKAGDRFPVDGVVATGSGDVDKSLLTGESLPEKTVPGDEAFAGTVSIDGGFELIASAVGADTAAGEIGRLLHDALWQRSPTSRLADKVAGYVVPAAVALALLTFLFWANRSGTEDALLNGLAVLLIACPCALGIATPLTTWLAVGKAADNGVIPRSFSAVENAAQVDHVAFDKTGTLTSRTFEIRAFECEGAPEDELLRLAASVEQRSEHPVGVAIVEAAGSDIELCDDFQVYPASGVGGVVEGLQVHVGNETLMRDESIVISGHLLEVASEWRRQGDLPVFVARDGTALGLIGLGENVRLDIAETFTRLVDQGVEVSILTGDSVEAGDRWREALGVAVTADLAPAEKSESVNRSGPSVAMVGDGINDAPSMASALVGISVSDASDVARSAADVVIVSDSLESVPWFLGLSRATMRKVRQNLTWAFGYNIVGMALAALGYLPPVVAAALMVTSSVVVTANSSRLRKYPPVAPKGSGP